MALLSSSTRHDCLLHVPTPVPCAWHHDARCHSRAQRECAHHGLPLTDSLSREVNSDRHGHGLANWRTQMHRFIRSNFWRFHMHRYYTTYANQIEEIARDQSTYTDHIPKAGLHAKRRAEAGIPIWLPDGSQAVSLLP